MKTNAVNSAMEILQKRKNDAESVARQKAAYLNGFTDFAANARQINLQMRDCGLAKLKKLDYGQEKTKLEKLFKERKGLLEKYGMTEADLFPSYKCPKCSDSGYAGGKRCACLNAEISDILLGESGIPIKNASFEADPKSPNAKVHVFAKEFCEKYPDTKRKNIILSGKTGTGKTYLASAVGNALASRQVDVRYFSAFDLSDLFLEYHLAPLEDKSLYKDVLAQTEALIIDDLGTEIFRANVTVTYLLWLLEKRVTAGNMTLITTNMDYSDLMKTYGERVMSRLSDKNAFYRIEMTGKDLRLS